MGFKMNLQGVPEHLLVIESIIVLKPGADLGIVHILPLLPGFLDAVKEFRLTGQDIEAEPGAIGIFKQHPEKGDIGFQLLTFQRVRQADGRSGRGIFARLD